MKISFADLKVPIRGIIVLAVEFKNKLSENGERINKQVDGALSRAADTANFSGKSGEYLAVIGPSANKNATYLLIGTGNKSEFDELEAQVFGATIIKAIQSLDKTDATVIVDFTLGKSIISDDVACQVAHFRDI